MEPEHHDPPEHTPPVAPAPADEGPLMGGRMPILGNAEWAMWLLVEIIFAIVWAASPAVDGGTFVQLTAIVTFAYLISRGIAKAGRVLER
jgi:hypothetical protein